jgi:hypothetical protein
MQEKPKTEIVKCRENHRKGYFYESVGGVFYSIENEKEENKLAELPLDLLRNGPKGEYSFQSVSRCRHS